MRVPATLPLEVLQTIQQDLLEWNGTGASVMEVSHRGKPFMAMAAEAEQDARDLLGIPDNYKVLFLQGWRANAIFFDTIEFNR